MYAELLRRALGEIDPEARVHASDAQLVEEFHRLRRLVNREAQPRDAAALEPGDRIGDNLRCDLLLIELCRRWGVVERIADPLSGPHERERVARELEARVVWMDRA